MTMTYNEQRRKIAEVMGWEDDYGWWPPEGDEMHGTAMGEDYLPDPLHSHDDAMAVVAWLKEQGAGVSIQIRPEFTQVYLSPPGSTKWIEYEDCSDYREGIVELMMEVIE